MRQAQIVIAGGGLAGSMAAAMLARDGFDVVLVDPHATYPPELRCEKLDGPQVELLRGSGLAQQVLAAGTPYGEFWVARFGRLVERRVESQVGILYDTLVNRMRAVVPERARCVVDKVTAIANGADRQLVTLSGGEQISARLVVVANGLNSGLRHAMGITRQDVSRCHSVTLAFNVRPRGGDRFPFQALTYYGERAADRVAYLTVFPVGDAMRANLMVYRAMDDPWLRAMRDSPEEAMTAVLPRLTALTGDVQVEGPVKIRPADLHFSRGHLQPGIVLVGDAFGTSCPAAGTGARKVFTDVQRLCQVYVPQWMRTGGMGLDKIGAFYDDPVKVASDRFSFDKAFHLRSLSVDESWPWQARRWARFVRWVAIGSGREALSSRLARLSA
jgi:2-polyprenyl-6-methoxyphenol hydroxylase-like FAD-dependent oxidoreductase